MGVADCVWLGACGGFLGGGPPPPPTMPPPPPPPHLPSHAVPGGQQHRFNSSYAVTLSSMQGDAQQGQQQGGALGADALARQQAAPLLVAAARLISQFPQVCWAAGRWCLNLW